MNTIRQYLQSLVDVATRYPQVVLIMLVALAIALVWLMLRWLGAKQVDVSDLKEKSAPEPTAEDSRTLGERIVAMRAAVRRLLGRDELYYKTPWYLVIDQPGRDVAISFAQDTETVTPLQTELIETSENSVAKWYSRAGLVLIKTDSNKIEEERNSDSTRHLKRLLHEMNDLRPERPLDGIILTVSAHRLRDPKFRMGYEEFITHTLKKLDESTSFVLPIYVVVTDTEDLPGFSSFLLQNEKQADQMFGWSNPNKLETAYKPGWLSDALNKIGDDIRRNQIEKAASSEQITEVDRFLLFDVAVSELETPLQSIVDVVFDETLYQDGYYFRGVYLTGVAEKADLAKPIFAKDLLLNRVWPERHIARPTDVGLLSANRTLRRYQVAMISAFLLLFGFLALNVWSLKKQTKSVTASVQAMDAIQHTWDYPEISEILQQMSLMNAQSLTHYAIPISWVSRVNDDVVRHIADTQFKGVIFPIIDCSLRVRLGELVGDVQTGATGLPQLLNGMDTFRKNHQDFVSISRVDTGAQSDVLAVFAELIDYLYDDKLESGFIKKSDLYRKSLEQVDYKFGSNAPPGCSSSKHIIESDTFNALWTALGDRASDTRDEIVASAGRSMTAAENGQEAIGEDMLQFGQWLETVRSKWLASPKQNPCRQLQARLMHTMDDWKGFGYANTNLPNSAVRQFDEDVCDVPFYNELLEQTYPQFGKVFVLDDTGDVPRFAKNVEDFMAQYASLKDLSFMQQTIQPTRRAPDTFLWSEPRLREALAYYREYEAYARQHSDTSAPLLQSAVLEKLQGAMGQSLRLAQEAAPVRVAALPVAAAEARLEVATTNFGKVMQSMIEIADVLAQLRFTVVENWFAAATHNYALDLIDRVDRLANDPRPLYAASIYPDWTKPDFLAALFNIPNKERLRDYMVEQRQRASYLAFNYAQPPITYLLNTNYTPPLPGEPDNVVKWRETLEQLDKYRRKDPSSHLQVLENFFQDALREPTEDCQYDPNPRLTGYSDIFARSHQTLVAEIEQHCKFNKSATVANDYWAVARKFNNHLAGKFPFSSVSEPREASPTAVRDFFKYYAEVSGDLATRLEAELNAEPRFQKPLEFIRTLDILAQLLGTDFPYVDGPGLTVKAQFRALKSPHTDQIITWRLERLDNGQAIERPAGVNDALTWSYGAPVNLAMTWAANSKIRPVASGDELIGVGGPDQRTLSFSESGNWALLRLVQRYRDTKVAARSVLLAFPAVLNSGAEQVKCDTEQTKCNFYVRLTIYSPDNERLVLPPSIPATAPKIES